MSAWTNAYWPRSGERGSTSLDEQLAPDERAEPRLERRPRRSPETAASPASVKLWPRTAASATSARSAGVEPVEPGRDQRGQRLGHGQVVEVAGRPVDAALEHEAALRQQHPDGLDRVQRDPVGAGDDRVAARPPAGPGTSPASSSRIASVGSGSRWIEVKLRLPAPQSGPALEQLGPGQGHDRGSGRCGSTPSGGR